MIRTQFTTRSLILTLLGLISAIFLSLAQSSSSTANSSFSAFRRDDYPTASTEVAKEIAYYSDYIIPLISQREGGCLGSRPRGGDEANFLAKDRTGEKDIFHINRCSQLHASDYARLNYIIYLNAFLKETSSRPNYLRYINKQTFEQKNADNNTTKKFFGDNDEQYVDSRLIHKNIYGIKSESASKFFPSASSDRISHHNLPSFMVPNLSLFDIKNAQLFGFGLYTPGSLAYQNMFTNVINYALRDCEQSTEDQLDLPGDKIANDRAILLNPEKATGDKVQELNHAYQTCFDDCQVRYKRSLDQTPREYETRSGQIESQSGAASTNQPNSAPNTQNIKHQANTEQPHNLKQCFAVEISKISETERNCLGSEHNRNLLFDSYKAIYIQTKKATDEALSQGEKTFFSHPSYQKIPGLKYQSNGGLTGDCDKNAFETSSCGEDWDCINEKNENAKNCATSHLGCFIHYRKAFQTCAGEVGEIDDKRQNEQCKQNCEQYNLKRKKLQLPTCASLVSILKQVDHPDDAAYFLNNQTNTNQGPKWLPLTEQEKIAIDYGRKPLDINRGGNKVIVHPEGKPRSTCYFRGFAAIGCTIANFLARISSGAFFLIEQVLIFPGELLNTQNGSTGYNLYAAWSAFRDIANLVLIVVFIISIISQLTGWKLNLWGVRQQIPRLILAAILINLSFFICQILVDLSNLAGTSLHTFFQGFGDSLNRNINLNTHNNETIFTTLVVFAIGGLALGYAIVNIFIILPVLFGTVVGVVMTVLMLIFRQVMIVVLIISAPVVFALASSQGSDKIMKNWWRMLYGVLIIYPLISLAFGVGELSYQIVAINAEVSDANIAFKLLSSGLLALPLFFVPTITKKFYQTIPYIGGALQELAKRPGQNVQKRLEQSKLVSASKFNRARQARRDQTGLSRPEAWHLLRRARSGLNRQLNRLPIYRERAGGEAADEKWLKEREANMYKLNGDRNVNFMRDFNTNKNNNTDDAVSALLTAADEGEGYFEDALIALNKLSHRLSSADLAAITDKAIRSYQENGRTEIAALLDNARSLRSDFKFSQSDNYEKIIESYAKELTGSGSHSDIMAAQAHITDRAFTGSIRRVGGINQQKFKSPDTNAAANTITNSFYGNKNLITSSGAARNAYRHLFNTNSVFREQVQRFENDNARKFHRQVGGETPES